MMDNEELIYVLQRNLDNKESIGQFVTTILNYLDQVENSESVLSRPRFTIFIKKFALAIKKYYKKEYFQVLEGNLLDLATNLDDITKSARGFGIYDETIEVRYDKDFFILAKEIEKLLLSVVIELEEFQEIKSYSSFYDLYIPEGSNRFDAERLIEEAIDIIRQDTSLTPEARQKIIAQLETALSSLRKGDNKDFFGTIKEATIILTALGLLTSGGHTLISQANGKINDAVDLIEKTSINQKYKTLGYKPSYFTDAYLLESKNLEALPPSTKDNEVKVLQASLETIPDNQADSKTITSPEKDANDFLQWVSSLPQTGVTLNDAAFDRGGIYE